MIHSNLDFHTLRQQFETALSMVGLTEVSIESA